MLRAITAVHKQSLIVRLRYLAEYATMPPSGVFSDQLLPPSGEWCNPGLA